MEFSYQLIDQKALLFVTKDGERECAAEVRFGSTALKCDQPPSPELSQKEFAPKLDEFCKLLAAHINSSDRQAHHDGMTRYMFEDFGVFTKYTATRKSPRQAAYEGAHVFLIFRFDDSGRKFFFGELVTDEKQKEYVTPLRAALGSTLFDLASVDPFNPRGSLISRLATQLAHGKHL